jgi:V-type H+-transporting ATPase subunit D
MIEVQIKGAQTGLGLLKNKSNAIQMRYRDIEDRLEKVEGKINTIFSRAFIELAKAQFYGGDVDILRNKCLKTPVSIVTEIKYVCGIALPAFTVIRPLSGPRQSSNAAVEHVEDEIIQMNGSTTHPGIVSMAGHRLREVRRIFETLLNLLVELASIKNTSFLLVSSLESTNRRINALEHLLIPKLVSTRNFILSELDEQEREELYRLKKIQKNKNIV